MADLKYDTETMRDVASEYREIAERMGKLEVILKRSIEDLKNTHWKSDAGRGFQNMYEEGWVSNVDKYILVLNEMARQLDHAANEYDTVTDKLTGIEGVSL